MFNRTYNNLFYLLITFSLTGTGVLFGSAPIVKDTVPSAIVIDEDESPPVHSVENETSIVFNDDKNSSMEIEEEHVSTAVPIIIDEVDIFVHNEKIIDDVSPTDENEEATVKHDKNEETRPTSNESDEEQEKPRHYKLPPPEEGQEEEVEEDGNNNKDEGGDFD